MKSDESKIWLSSPHMGDKEKEFVQEAFDTNWIAPLGPNVDGFERDLELFNGIEHAAALSSGTAALHLGLVLLDVNPGDFVICQSMTFSASANPIIYQGAIPIFIDSEPDTWNMCPKALKEAIDRYSGVKEIVINQVKVNCTGIIKAIIPVHLYGMPAKMDEITAVAKQFGIPVLEDAAEALGSTFKGKACGSFSELGVLSFNGNKIITTSGGGALLSNNRVLIEKAKFLATQARDPAAHYQHSCIGYNYRLSNILAGIGRGQMSVLSDRVNARRANFKKYKGYFSNKKGIKLQEEPTSDFFSNRWLTGILVDPVRTGGIDREAIRIYLESKNIEARPLWKPMHMQPVFQYYPYVGSNCSEYLFETGLCLPSGSNLKREDWNRIVSALEDVLV